MLQERGSKKFSKSLLGSPSHSAGSSASLASLLLPCDAESLGVGGCQLSATRKRKALSGNGSRALALLAALGFF